MFRLVETSWATKTDLRKGSLWKAWNVEHRLPRWFWQRAWEYPWVFNNIEKQSTLLDVGGTYPFVLFSEVPHAKSVDSRDLNQVDHYLHKNLWPQGTLIISDARRIDLPDQSFETVISISALEEMPNPELVLQEMMRLARKRVIITCDIRGSGISVSEFEKIFSRWGVKFNPPSDALTSLSLILLKYRQRPVFKNRRIRVVGLVFDRNH